MRLALKILSALVLVASLVFAYLLGAVMLVEGKNVINPYIDTWFSAEYSPEKFETIQLGMTKTDVINLIGQPLYTGKNPFDSLITNYYFTSDGKLYYGSVHNHGKHGDFAWYRSSLGLDSNGIVVSIDKGWSYD